MRRQANAARKQHSPYRRRVVGAGSWPAINLIARETRPTRSYGGPNAPAQPSATEQLPPITGYRAARKETAATKSRREENAEPHFNCGRRKRTALTGPATGCR